MLYPSIRIGVYLVNADAHCATLKVSPLLVQRCNGTTAGPGYLEVLELSRQFLLLGQLASVRTVNCQSGRRIQIPLLT
jgi:hypothetical protein